MALKDKIIKLATEKSNPSVTISLNTHRTHPDSVKDGIMLKNLLVEAEKQVIHEFGKRSVSSLLDKIGTVGEEIDINYNLDSLHIFLSNDTKEIIKTTWVTYEDRVYISDSFDIRPLIKACNRTQGYLILVLSQGGVMLYEALNDGIVGEIKNEDFPFGENPHYIPEAERRSDAKLVDNMIKEFFNKIDKATNRIVKEKELDCIVISTESNYDLLKEVADNPKIYMGHSPIDYNNVQPHNLVKQSWDLIRKLLAKERTEAIEEMEEAVSESKVITNLKDIYTAAIDGRGDMLIVNENFSQPAEIIDDRNIKLGKDSSSSEVVDDITSTIAWEVMSKGGRVYFTGQEQLDKFGNIVMKVRY